jgi:alpha-glucosidase
MVLMEISFVRRSTHIAPIVCFALGCAASLLAQQVVPTASGAKATANGTTLEVTALRDDVLRVREWRGDNVPEDSSWAVLPASRTAHIAVTPQPNGFETKDMKVAIDPELRLTVSDLAGHILQSDAEPIQYDGHNFKIYKKLTDDEHFFGLGDKVGPLDRRGMAFADWNTDIGWTANTDPIYKSIPFFYSWRQGRVLGVLFDNTWRADFDFGKDRYHEYSFGSTDGPVDYYLMYGPGPKQVVEDYAWLTGPTPLPPLWTLGYQQSRYSYYPESRVKEIADTLRADKIPTDVIWLDIDYQQNNRPFTVNHERFPTFEQMIADLKKQDFHTVVITDLHIADLPNAGYKPYDEGEAQDRFVKMPDGKDFVGWVWPGSSVFPNYTEADTRAWWGSLYKQFLADGIAGFWNDMNEPSVFNVPNKTMPDDAQHVIRGDQAWGFKDRTAEHLEIHNVFGMLQTEGTYEGFRKLNPDVRPFVMTRASYAGGQRYSATWTGDNSSTWNQLRLTTPMLENLGLSGFAMAGADVGGFRGSPQMDLLTKWMEQGAFQPIDRDHTSSDTLNQEPWVGGSAQEAMRRRYIDARYELMPYLYTTAKTMSETGVPLIRPMFLEFPDAEPDKSPIDLDAPAQFMFGPDLLVAPPEFPDEVQDYDVILPQGIWYDYWTGDRIDRETVADSKANPVTITPTLEDLPVYARGGSVVPEEPLVQSTMQTPDGPLTLHIYPGPADSSGHVCSGEVYQDDGISYAFEHGDSLRIKTECTQNQGEMTIQVGAHQGTYKPWWHAVTLEVYGWQGSGAPAASMGGKTLAVRQNPTRAAWDITVPDNGQGMSVQLH